MLIKNKRNYVNYYEKGSPNIIDEIKHLDKQAIKKKHLHVNEHDIVCYFNFKLENGIPGIDRSEEQRLS